MLILAASAATVAASMITLGRVIGYRRMFKHATLVDVAFTVLMVLIFAGTLTGMLVAIVAGLMMALVLSAGRYLLRFFEQTENNSEFTASGEWIYNTKPYV
jgi:hypothetical protein